MKIEKVYKNILSFLSARNIYRTLFKHEHAKVNELFAPRRMAYVMELDEDDTEIPTTLIRSKADCPVDEVSLFTGELCHFLMRI